MDYNTGEVCDLYCLSSILRACPPLLLCSPKLLVVTAGPSNEGLEEFCVGLAL